ncbi:MAG: SDR family oxidoreductase [bacterium]|nr:SDR family oxidoreductase [bacterium]
MLILIIGASGFVGSYLSDSLSKEAEAIGTFCHRQPEVEGISSQGLRYLDVTDKESVEGLIRETKPSTIILTSALTYVDYCEGHQSEAYDINVAGTRNVVSMAKKVDAKLVFFSTEYVFDGKGGPYSEIDLPNPINYYGQTKLEAEKVIIENLLDYLIIRTTVVYGYQRNGKNFILQLIQKNKEGQVMNVPLDQYGSPTFRDNLAEVTIELIRKDKRGIYNVVGTEVMNRYDFSILAAAIFGLNQDLIIPKTTLELGQVALRPLKAGLKIDKVAGEIEIRLLSPKQGLEILKGQLVAKGIL